MEPVHMNDLGLFSTLKLSFIVGIYNKDSLSQLES